MSKKKKDIKLLIVLCLTAVFGLIHLLLNGNKVLVFAYLACMCVIPILYFNYSLCKWGIRWENMWKEKNPGSGEPSEYWLARTKIGAWVIFILGMILALIPKM